MLLPGVKACGIPAMAMAEAVPALALRSTVSMRLAIEPIAPFNCRTFTASAALTPSATLVMAFSPASMPAVVIAGPARDGQPAGVHQRIADRHAACGPQIDIFRQFHRQRVGSIGHYANVSSVSVPAAPPTIWTVSPSLRATGCATVSRKSQRIAGRARHLCQLVFGGRLAAGVVQRIKRGIGLGPPNGACCPADRDGVVTRGDKLRSRYRTQKVGLLTTLTCNWLPVSTAVVLLPLTTSTVPLGAILVTGPPLACRFQPALAVC